MESNNLNKSLKKEGFAIVDLLSEAEVACLNALVVQYLKSNGADFVSSSHFLSESESNAINVQLQAILKPKIDALFPDLELLGGTLATKYKGNASVKAHNDWAIVDETKYNSYNLWIPLVAVNRQNGTLGLIPGSHLWEHEVRGFGIPGQFETFTNKFLKIGFEPELKAGQAILYHHRLVHFSRPNTTSIPRSVAIIGMKDKAAQLQVSFTVDDKVIETYQATEADFYGFDAKRIKEKNRIIEAKPIEKNKIVWSEIERQLKQFPSNYAPINQNSWVHFLATFRWWK